MYGGGGLGDGPIIGVKNDPWAAEDTVAPMTARRRRIAIAVVGAILLILIVLPFSGLL
jgi:hypothetical protein